MNVANLVNMANDIAAFFDGEFGLQEAPQHVALHISRYWDPRMRTQIIAHVNAGGSGLGASSLTAVKSLPAPSRS
jgi:formate dehydrogenase subunit delta